MESKIAKSGLVLRKTALRTLNRQEILLVAGASDDGGGDFENGDTGDTGMGGASDACEMSIIACSASCAASCTCPAPASASCVSCIGCAPSIGLCSPSMMGCPAPVPAPAPAPHPGGG